MFQVKINKVPSKNRFVKITFCISAFVASASSLFAEDEKNFWCEYEALYFHPWEKSAVVTNQYSPVLTTNDFTETKALHPDFRWDIGFRIRVGYFFVPPRWSIDLGWTNFTTKDIHNKTTNTNDYANLNQSGSFPIWDLEKDILPGAYVSNSYLKWNLALNILDLNFTRTIPFTRICVKTFAGLRGSWIRQKFYIRYSGGIFNLTFNNSYGNSVIGNEIVTMKNNYRGLGPRIGVTPSFDIGKGFVVDALGAMSVLLGQLEKNQKGEYLSSERFYIHSDPFDLSWIIDVAVRLGYHMAIFQSRYDVSFKLGYEFHEYYHQMELTRDHFHVAPHDSNLRLQGVVGYVQIDF